MITVIIIVLTILALGPARPFILNNLRFFIPAAAGVVIFVTIALFALSVSPLPAPLSWIVIAYAAWWGIVDCGGSIKDWIDRTFGPRR